MAGKHRAPTPVRPSVPRFAVGAVVASTVLTASAPTVMPMVTTEPLPAQHAQVSLLPMPMWTPALAALYLPHLDTPAPTQTVDPSPATHTVTLTADTHPTDAPHGTKHPEPVTVKAAGVTGGLTARAISAAMGQQGVNYVYGGDTPGKALDCSALVQYAFHAAGISLPRTAADQSSSGRTIRLADVQPGDLLFYDYGGGISHVAMAIGGNRVVEASQPGHPVAVRSLYTNSLSVIKRLIG